MTNLAVAKSLQSCPTLCDPIDGSPPGSPVPGILKARTLEWTAISFSSAWKWKVKVKSLSPVQLFATPWTAAYQAPPSMGFLRQEYWNGLPLPSLFTTLKVTKKTDWSVWIAQYIGWQTLLLALGPCCVTKAMLNLSLLLRTLDSPCTQLKTEDKLSPLSCITIHISGSN